MIFYWFSVLFSVPILEIKYNITNRNESEADPYNFIIKLI